MKKVIGLMIAQVVLIGLGVYYLCIDSLLVGTILVGVNTGFFILNIKTLKLIKQGKTD